MFQNNFDLLLIEFQLLCFRRFLKGLIDEFPET